LSRYGFSHVGVSTHDMDATIRFYEDVLGFPRVVEETMRVKEGGTLRQAFFDVGGDQYIVFMEPRGIPGIGDEYDTGINAALGTPGGMYHFALKSTSLDDLAARREALASRGIDVSDIIDLGFAKSIFFADPNGIQFEFSCQIRPFDESDLGQESAASISLPD